MQSIFKIRHQEEKARSINSKKNLHQGAEGGAMVTTKKKPHFPTSEMKL